MKIQQIRNATLIIGYGGKKFLIDPMLSAKGTFPAFPNSLRNDEQPNPIVELPIPVGEIIKGIDAVFLSHLHIDHWDDAAKEVLPRQIKIFVQDEHDKQEVASLGFLNVEVLTTHTSFEGILLSKTKAQHGRGEILKLAGNVCGLVLSHPAEKRLYIAADTVWFEGVQEALDQYQPDVIVLNGGDNQFAEGGPLIMGKEDIQEVYKASTTANIIVCHMEAVNHYTLTRAELKEFLAEKKMSDRVFVPDDGEFINF